MRAEHQKLAVAPKLETNVIVDMYEIPSLHPAILTDISSEKPSNTQVKIQMQC